MYCDIIFYLKFKNKKIFYFIFFTFFDKLTAVLSCKNGIAHKALNTIFLKYFILGLKIFVLFDIISFV